MIKSIKFLDVDHNGRNYSFQLHLFDYYDRDSFNVRVFYVISEFVTPFFNLLKLMLPNNDKRFKAYCETLSKDCCSRIIVDYYSDQDVNSFEVGFRKDGIKFEKAGYTSMLPTNSDEQCWSLRMKGSEHIELIERNLFTLDLSNNREVQYAIMRTAEILTSTNLATGLELDFQGFVLAMLNESGYEVRDIRGTEIVYEDNFFTIDVNEDIDDVRYLYALAYMVYATFVEGGILVVDRCDLLDPSSLLYLVQLYKGGISGRAKPQLIISSPDEHLYKTKYKARVVSTSSMYVTHPNSSTSSTSSTSPAVSSIIAVADLWHKYL